MAVYEVETWANSQHVETRRTTRTGATITTETIDAGGAISTRPATDGEISALESLEAAEAVTFTDPLHQLAQAIVDAATLEDVKPAAQAILADGTI